jgi:hypothetical protein
MHTCLVKYLANAVGFTNIDTILYLSHSDVTVTETLLWKVPGCTQNLESVFPVRSVPLTWFLWKVSWCQPTVSKQLLHFLWIFLRTQHRWFLDTSSVFLNTVFHHLFMKYLLLHKILHCCFVLCYTLWNRSKWTLCSCESISQSDHLHCMSKEKWQNSHCLSQVATLTPVVVCARQHCVFPQAGGHARCVSQCWHKNFTWIQ